MSKVLIIDDQEDICFLLSNILKRNGVSCDTAHTLAQGYSLLETHQYDCIFLDNNLPDGFGIDNIEKIKKQSITKVIMITAFANEVIETSARLKGVDDFIHKPFKILSIQNIVEALLRA
ncbi:response regulator [Ferruginibacter albus]|uniref:response regulator n=1 Tax=Ferruginibacter albus TaxID=2875540 RepID=UPI001CC4E793|nr:response regulator [Ferruginibacter albus]UAY52859.1 response regulator [Ferruginibacter albus]